MPINIDHVLDNRVRGMESIDGRGLKLEKQELVGRFLAHRWLSHLSTYVAVSMRILKREGLAQIASNVSLLRWNEIFVKA